MLETAKPTGRPYQCVDCEQVFVQEGSGPLRTRCKPCRRKYISSLPSQRGKPVPPRHRPYTCAKCGKADIDTGKGRFRKYCKDCANPSALTLIRECEGCGEPFVTNRKTKRRCQKGCGQRHNIQQTCHWCGDRFTGTKPMGGGHRTGKSYCSQECLGADRRVKHEAVPWKTCDICETRYIRRAGVSCPICDREPLGPYRGISDQPRTGFVFVAGNCQECEAQFVGRVTTFHHLPLFCSDQCRKRQHKRKWGGEFNTRGRRITRRTGAVYEPINRVRVLADDDFICHLCGISTDPDAEPCSDRYPSVDHVIPLSKGGDHTYDNVRCACFGCNWKKAANGSHTPTRGTRKRNISTPRPHAVLSLYGPGGFE